MMGFDSYGMSPGMWITGGLMMVLFWGGLILLVVWAIRTVRGPSPTNSGKCARGAENTPGRRRDHQ